MSKIQYPYVEQKEVKTDYRNINYYKKYEDVAAMLHYTLFS